METHHLPYADATCTFTPGSYGNWKNSDSKTVDCSVSYHCEGGARVLTIESPDFIRVDHVMCQGDGEGCPTISTYQSPSLSTVYKKEENGAVILTWKNVTDACRS